MAIDNDEPLAGHPKCGGDDVTNHRAGHVDHVLPPAQEAEGDGHDVTRATSDQDDIGCRWLRWRQGRKARRARPCKRDNWHRRQDIHRHYRLRRDSACHDARLPCDVSRGWRNHSRNVRTRRIARAVRRDCARQCRCGGRPPGGLHRRRRPRRSGRCNCAGGPGGCSCGAGSGGHSRGRGCRRDCVGRLGRGCGRCCSSCCRCRWGSHCRGSRCHGRCRGCRRRSRDRRRRHCGRRNRHSGSRGGPNGCRGRRRGRRGNRGEGPVGGRGRRGKRGGRPAGGRGCPGGRGGQANGRSRGGGPGDSSCSAGCRLGRAGQREECQRVAPRVGPGRRGRGRAGRVGPAARGQVHDAARRGWSAGGVRRRSGDAPRNTRRGAEPRRSRLHRRVGDPELRSLGLWRVRVRPSPP
mmetsp:Transcript_34681/g.103668  ORF Transcript_34681/g.103668 Transcript_34681/m.103668 type:complete len:408 (-) Transcript_34681:2355-3578(-)